MAKDVLKEHIPGIKEHGYNLTQASFVSLTEDLATTVDSSPQYTIGSRGRDAAGNEYIYLAGVASVTANTWISFDEAFVVTLLTTTSVGSVGVAMGAITDGNYGWFQIYGSGSGIIGNTTSGDRALFISSVTGSVDDLVVTGDLIFGAWSRSTSSVTGSAIDVQLNYPFTTQTSGAY